MHKKNTAFEYLFLMYIGATTYTSMEIVWRGYSHWTMLILGALCFIFLGLENQVLPWSTPLWIQMILGGGIVSIFELGTGIIVNVLLGWHVWNYSNLPFNFMGQISLFSSIGWCFLSLIGIVLDDYLRYWFFDEEKPHYTIF